MQSDRSADKYCDDIFGETPTGVRKSVSIWFNFSNFVANHDIVLIIDGLSFLNDNLGSPSSVFFHILVFSSAFSIKHALVYILQPSAPKISSLYCSRRLFLAGYYHLLQLFSFIINVHFSAFFYA